MKSVCIVGFFAPTRALANSEPPEVELWGMNESHTFMRRYDRWFQLHPQSWHRGKYGRNDAHLEFLRTCGVPLYMNDPMADFSTAVLYPYDAIRDDLGRDYLTSTAAHAVALAIHERYDEIKVFGVNLATDTEYIEQRPCMEWLLGVAEGRGIKVTLPQQTMLLKGRRYPLGDTSATDLIQEHLRQLRADFMSTWAKVYQLIGAYKACVKMNENPHAIRLQFVKEMMTLQNLRGEIKSSAFDLRAMGASDVSKGDLPEIEIPAELLEVEGVVATMSNIIDLPMARGVVTR